MFISSFEDNSSNLCYFFSGQTNVIILHSYNQPDLYLWPLTYIAFLPRETAQRWLDNYTMLLQHERQREETNYGADKLFAYSWIAPHLAGCTQKPSILLFYSLLSVEHLGPSRHHSFNLLPASQWNFLMCKKHIFHTINFSRCLLKITVYMRSCCIELTIIVYHRLPFLHIFPWAHSIYRSE